MRNELIKMFFCPCFDVEVPFPIVKPLNRKRLVCKFESTVSFDIDLMLAGLDILDAWRIFSCSTLELKEISQRHNLSCQHVVDRTTESVVTGGADCVFS